MRPHHVPAEAIEAAWRDTSVGLIEHGWSLGVSSSWLSRQARHVLGLTGRDVRHLKLRRRSDDRQQAVSQCVGRSEPVWTPPLCAKPPEQWSPGRRAAERRLREWVG